MGVTWWGYILLFSCIFEYLNVCYELTNSYFKQETDLCIRGSYSDPFSRNVEMYSEIDYGFTDRTLVFINLEV